MTREEKIAAIHREEKIAAIKKKEAELAEDKLNPEASGLSPRDRVPVTEEGIDAAFAVGAGAVEGATLGFSSEIGAGAETILDITKGDLTLGSFGEAYIGKRNSYEEALEDIEKNNPAAFGVGNVTGAMVTGGAALGLGGIPASVATGLAAGLGYSEPKKRSETLSLEEAADAVVRAGGWEIAGNLAPVGIAKIADSQTAKTAGMFKEYMAGTLAEAFGYAGKIRKELNTKLRRGGRSMQDWADNLMSLKDKKGVGLIEPGQTYTETYDKLVQFSDEIGADIGNLVRKASKESETVKGDSIFHNITSDYLDPILDSGDEFATSQASKHVDSLKRNFFNEVPETKITFDAEGNIAGKVETMKLEAKDLTLEDLQRMKTQIGKRLRDKEGKKVIVSNSADLSRQQFDEKVVGALTGEIDEGVLRSPMVKEDETIMNAFLAHKKNYGDLEHAEIAIAQTIDKLDSPGVLSSLKDALNYRGMVMAGITRSMGVPDKAAIGVGMAFNKLVVNPSTPASMVHQLKKVADAFANNPDKFEKLAAKIGAAATKNNLVLGQTLSEANSTVDLMQNPIPRSTEEAEKRKDDILTIMHGQGMFDEASALRKSLNEGNASGQLHTLSQNPKLAEFFQAGMGWDGRAVTEEEKQEIEAQVKGKFGLKIQSELLTKFRQDSVIPDLEQEDQLQEAIIYDKAKDKAKRKPY